MDTPIKVEPPVGKSLKITLPVDLIDVFKGTTKKINLTRFVQCHYCSGNKATKNMTCESCQGHGMILNVDVIINRIPPKPCPECLGSGLVGDIEDYPCNHCGATGLLRKNEEVAIYIPRGIGENDSIIIKHKGNNSPLGAAGDLIINFKENLDKDNIYERNGLDIIKKEFFNISDLVLGTTRSITLLDDSIIEVKIPKGTNPGSLPPLLLGSDF